MNFLILIFLFPGFFGPSSAECSPLIASFSSDFAFSENGNLKELYQRTTNFDFRNDEVFQPNETTLSGITSKPLNDKSIEKILSGNVSLIFLQTLAFARNPDLESSKKTIQARAEMYPQTMFVDALAAQYRSFTQAIETRTSSSAMGESQELFFPSPGISTFNGKLARLEVEMAMEEYFMKLRNLEIKLLNKAAEYQMFRASISVTEKNLAALEAFGNSLKTRFITGKSMYPELTRLQVEQDRMKNDRASMLRMQKASIAEINHLLARAADGSFGSIQLPSLNFPVDRKNLTQAAQEKRQEVRIAEIGIKLLETLLSLKKRFVFAKISPGFAYPKSGMTSKSNQSNSEMGIGKNSSAALDSYKISFGTDVTMPNPLELAEQASYLRELEQQIGSEKAKVAEIRNSTISELTEAVTGFENARESLKTERNIVFPRLETTLDSAGSAYRTGQIAFSDWMELFLSSFSSQMNSIRYEFEAYKALGKIFEVSGSCNFPTGKN
ncbi:MAG: TolC family protein [Candidatus Riflebacteria bacterium]|nr:TolC family protein [Candidatus Riflebacteria bacterium]